MVAETASGEHPDGGVVGFGAGAVDLMVEGRVDLGKGAADLPGGPGDDPGHDGGRGRVDGGRGRAWRVAAGLAGAAGTVQPTAPPGVWVPLPMPQRAQLPAHAVGIGEG